MFHTSDQPAPLSDSSDPNVQLNITALDISLEDIKGLNSSPNQDNVNQVLGSLQFKVEELDGDPTLEPNPNDQHPTRDS